MAVLITNQQNQHPIESSGVQRKAQAILNALACPEAELSVLIVDDARMAELNREYRNRPGPTNVIAFAMQEGAFADITPELLGDVVISTEYVDREAREMGLSFTRRFDEMLIHGILHLVGYDHERGPAEAERMETRTDELLTAIGSDLDPEKKKI